MTPNDTTDSARATPCPMGNPLLARLPEFLTSDEVAELLRVNKATLRDLWRTGKIPKPLQLNARLYRWPKAELLAALEKARATI